MNILTLAIISYRDVKSFVYSEILTVNMRKLHENYVISVNFYSIHIFNKIDK